MFSCTLRILFITQRTEGRSAAQHVLIVLPYKAISPYRQDCRIPGQFCHLPIHVALLSRMTYYTPGATLYPQCNASFCRLVFLCVAAFKACVCIPSVCNSFNSMVSEILKVVGEYVQRLQGMSYVPPFSFQRGLYRDDGGPNRLFFTYLFCDKALAIRFLQDVKLIRSQVLCEFCGRFMRLCAEPRCYLGFRWRCNTRSAGMTCRRSMSIRDGSWFQQSNLTLLEILLLTYCNYSSCP